MAKTVLRPVRRVAMLVAILALASCAADRPYNGPITVPFTSAFAMLDSRELEEPTPPIGQLSHTLRAGPDHLLFADHILRRILLYDEDGTLQGSFGRAGDDPGGFRSLSGVGMGPDGRLLLSDNGKARLTFLHPDLEPDTAMQVGAVIGTLVGTAGGYVADVYASRDGDRLQLLDANGRLGRSFMPLPPATQENPYWSSFAWVRVAVVGSEIVASDGLTYPIRIFDAQGDSVGVLASPPPSFEPIPVVAAGAFSGMPGESLNRFVESFTTIGYLVSLDDKYLVVVHGRMHQALSQSFDMKHESIDVYDLASRRKILEDIRVPEGALVLAGGSSLVMLMTSPPEPWRVETFELTLPVQ